MSKVNADLLYDIIYDFLGQNDIMVIELAMLFKKIEIEQIENYITRTVEGEDEGD